jgi:hypothetical protein
MKACTKFSADEMALFSGVLRVLPNVEFYVEGSKVIFERVEKVDARPWVGACIDKEDGLYFTEYDGVRYTGRSFGEVMDALNAAHPDKVFSYYGSPSSIPMETHEK